MDATELIQKIPVQQNLTALAYESIKKHILEGRLTVDTRLTEESLSQLLGISKSPIREALNGLQNEGLIRIEPRRGAFLRTFSIQEVRDLYDLREVLEVFAVSTARITPGLLDKLNASIKRTSQFLLADDRNAHIEEDSRFHGLIAESTGNRELCRILGNIQNQIWLFRCQTYNLSSSTAPKAHKAILESLKKHDLLAAQRAMREHIGTVRNKLLEHLSEEI